jgi:hypothetical protein
VPVVVVRTFTGSVTVTAPPEVAAGPGPVCREGPELVFVLSVSVPEKFVVAPALAFMKTPAPPFGADGAGEVSVPPVAFWMSTAPLRRRVLSDRARVADGPRAPG